LASQERHTAVITFQEHFNPYYETFDKEAYITTYHRINVPDNLAVGAYDLRVYLTNQNGAPFTSETSSGQKSEYVQITTLEYPSLSSTDTLIPENPADGYFVEERQNVISLSGYDLVTQTVKESGIRLGLIWQVIARPAGDYTVFIHIRDNDNNVVAQVDNKPLNWTYPTTEWQPGHYIYDDYKVALDNLVYRGQYTIFVGLYNDKTLQRMAIVDSENQRYIDDEIPLSTVEIW
jgi:hypothetical protein